MLNDLIHELSKFTPPIDGDPNVWLEREKILIDGKVWRQFLCGSCHGVYRCVNSEFQILAVQNTKKNDNFDRVLGWFETSCKRDGYSLTFLEVGNPRLKEKLERLGFVGTEEKMTKTF